MTFQLVGSLDDIPNHDALLDDLDARAEWYAGNECDEEEAADDPCVDDGYGDY